MVNISCSRSSGQLIIVQSPEHISHEYQMFKIGCSGDMHIRDGDYVISSVSIRYDLQSVVKEIKKYLDRHFEARGSCYGETNYKISDVINRIQNLVSEIEPPKKHRVVSSSSGLYEKVSKKKLDAAGALLVVEGVLHVAWLGISTVGIAYEVYRGVSWGYSYFKGSKKSERE